MWLSTDCHYSYDPRGVIRFMTTYHVITGAHNPHLACQYVSLTTTIKRQKNQSNKQKIVINCPKPEEFTGDKISLNVIILETLSFPKIATSALTIVQSRDVSQDTRLVTQNTWRHQLPWNVWCHKSHVWFPPISASLSSILTWYSTALCYWIFYVQIGIVVSGMYSEWV